VCCAAVLASAPPPPPAAPAQRGLGLGGSVAVATVQGALRHAVELVDICPGGAAAAAAARTPPRQQRRLLEHQLITLLGDLDRGDHALPVIDYQPPPCD
jgi:hypothetical protein